MEDEVYALVKDVPERVWKKLGQDIGKADGKVIVLVHPFYRKADDPKYNAAVEKLLKQSRTPVVVLEEHHNVAETKERIARMGAPNHLVLPTVENFSHLRLNHVSGAEPVFDYDLEYFSRILQEAGARRVFVGGMQTIQTIHKDKAEVVRRYERSWLPKHRRPLKNPIADCCAGNVYYSFINSNKFEKVRLMSHACHPHKPQYPKKRVK